VSRPTAAPPEDRVPLAPAWHTAALVGLILAVAAAGTLLGRDAAPAPSPEPHRIAMVYLPVAFVQMGLFYYVVRVGRRGSALLRLLGGGGWNAKRALADVGIAGALWAWVAAMGLVAARVFGAQSAHAGALFPTSTAERIAWTVLAILVGVTEELVYRGYLRVQLAAFTRSAALGIALQALLFGIAHLNQGGWMAVEIAIDGAVFGIVAHWRRGLTACIASHVATDVLAGLAG
jgi:membrane protease YdiL (CAAX protease family)